jgi:hypothetical protein
LETRTTGDFLFVDVVPEIVLVQNPVAEKTETVVDDRVPRFARDSAIDEFEIAVLGVESVIFKSEKTVSVDEQDPSHHVREILGHFSPVDGVPSNRQIFTRLRTRPAG